MLIAYLITIVGWRIANWALLRKKFSNFNFSDILFNWEACLNYGLLPPGVHIFKVDGIATGKPGPTGIDGVLHNYKGEVLFMFSKHVSVCDSNEVEALTILEARCCF